MTNTMGTFYREQELEKQFLPIEYEANAVCI